MTTIETKEARLNELKAELAEIRAEMKEDSISNARWGRLQNYRYEIRCEIEKLQAEIDAEIEKVAAQKVDAILTSDVQPVIVNTTFKNNRCSVNIDGAKVSLDKATQILFESELAKGGENVLLINENSDVCPLDEDLFILGKHNVKTAIRQFARGEKVTGAKVLNGKFYPVVKANAEPAVEETAIVEAEIVEVKTASEMKAAYAASSNVVRVHFTAKGKQAWQSIFHYGLNDRETCYQRTSKTAAAAELAKFGLTTEQVIAVKKAQDAINAEESEAYKTARNEGRRYSRLGYDKVYQKALAMVFGEDEPATVEETAASLPESPASVVKPLNFTAKIIYDNGCIDARFASYDEAYSWIKDQENVFPRFNSTITFFNRETLDAELLYQNSNDDTEPEPPNNDGDELIDTPVEPVISKEQLIDSLERAMTTALEKFQGFCLVKNLTAAENELKLYNICRLATRELWR